MASVGLSHLSVVRERFTSDLHASVCTAQHSTAQHSTALPPCSVESPETAPDTLIGRSVGNISILTFAVTNQDRDLGSSMLLVLMQGPGLEGLPIFRSLGLGR